MTLSRPQLKMPNRANVCAIAMVYALSWLTLEPAPASDKAEGTVTKGPTYGGIGNLASSCFSSDTNVNDQEVYVVDPINALLYAFSVSDIIERGVNATAKWSASTGQNYGTPVYNPDSQTIRVGNKVFNRTDGSLACTLSSETTYNSSTSRYWNTANNTFSTTQGSGDKTVVFVAQYEKNLQAIDVTIPGSPSTLWTTALDDYVYTASPLVDSDGTVYINDEGGSLYAINGVTGAKKWTAKTATDVSFNHPAIILYTFEGTNIIVKASGSTIYAYDNDGNLLWQTDVGSQITSPPTAAPGGSSGLSVTCGCSDGKVYHLDAETGMNMGYSDKLSQAISSSRSSSAAQSAGKQISGTTDIRCAPAHGADGTIFTANSTGTFYALSATGTVKWTATLNAGVQTSPAILSDGTVIVVTKSGTIYAIATNCGGLATSGWPTLGGNNQRNGEGSGQSSSTPSVTVAASDATGSETGPDSGTFTVTLSAAATSALTVNFTLGGTADSGDYNASATASVTIAAGATTGTITITPIDDSTAENDETVILTLASGTGYTLGSTTSATVTILDNDTDPVAQFVTRFYTLCLLRDPDSAGLEQWVTNLKSGASTGADVGSGFIFSDEFQNRNLDNSAWLDVLYQAFFNRAADTAGKNGWLEQMNAGTSKQTVLNGFTQGAEFVTLCNKYGILPYAGYVDPVKTFVTRFYTLCLLRDPDTTGLNTWAYNLHNNLSTGASVGSGFIFSAEFQARNLDNSAWLDVLYQAFFGRDADEAGKAGWLSQLNSGTSKQAVLDGFTHAQEFINLCGQYGIQPY